MKKNKLVLLLIPFLFIPNIFASGLKGYCFKATTSLDKVISQMNAFALPQDKIFKRESLNCIEVKLSDARHNMFVTILEKKFPLTRTYGGAKSKSLATKYSQKNNCKIEILKVTNKSAKGNSAKVGPKSNLSKSVSKGSRTTSSRLLLAPGRSANISLDGTSVDIKCYPSGNSMARVDVSLSYDASRLISSINTRKGKRVNLGQIVDKLNDKSKEISLRRGLEYKKENSKRSSNFYLIYQ